VDISVGRPLFDSFIQLGAPAPGGLIKQEIGGYRHSDGASPLVIEGVPDALAGVPGAGPGLLVNSWPDEWGPLWMQGWDVRLTGRDLEVFEPLNTPDQPRGYRLIS